MEEKREEGGGMGARQGGAGEGVEKEKVYSRQLRRVGNCCWT